MTTDSVIGLDVGSTLIKAARFDLRGREIAVAERRVPLINPRPGWVERDAAATWRAAAACLRAVAAPRVVAVGVTGCGNGAVFIDRAARPVRAGILSSDTRARGFVRSRRNVKGYPGQLAALAAWLRATEPAMAGRVATALFWKDFVRLQLTGNILTDFTDVGASGPPYRWLPPVQSSLAPAGGVLSKVAALTGLRTGIPVVTGCIDCEATAIGSGVRRAGEVSVVGGTWSINQAFLTARPRSRGHFLVNRSVEDGRWLVLEGSASSAGNFDWAVQALGCVGGVRQALEEAARATASDLLFLPEVPGGRGAFVGLGPSHGRGELFRAVMEGVVLTHRRHVEALGRSLGPVRRVVLAGGVARSQFWCRIFADGLGCRVDVPRSRQLGALGAAICAGVGAGIWPSVAAAQRAMTHTALSYRPNPARRAALSRAFDRISNFGPLLSRDSEF
jgi:L-xylulokinase